MAKAPIAQMSSDEVQITDEGMKINVVLPAKVFKTGRKGFFKQGAYTAPDGTKYRVNFQAYEATKK